MKRIKETGREGREKENKGFRKMCTKEGGKYIGDEGQERKGKKGGGEGS